MELSNKVKFARDNINRQAYKLFCEDKVSYNYVINTRAELTTIIDELRLALMKVEKLEKELKRYGSKR